MLTSVDKTNGSDKIQYSVAEAQPDLPGQKTYFHEHTQSIEGGGYGQPLMLRSISTIKREIMMTFERSAVDETL